MEAAAASGMPHKGDVAFRDKLGLSIYIGGESVVDKLSIVGGLGYIVAQKRFSGSSPAFEQRLGFKYHFYRNFFAGMNLRAYRFRAAEAIEFHVGVRRYL